MPKLIITMDGAVIREHVIDSDSISIGRKAGNDIQLNDLTVSGRHALLSTLGEHTYVDDLGSTNGTLLNGKRVNKSRLKHSDVIQIGTHQFTFFSEEEAPYEPTMFIKAEFEPTKVINTRPGDDSGARGEPLGAVRVKTGPLANKVLELRKPFNTLGFNGKKMAMISRNPGGYTIATLKSIHLRRDSDVPVVNGVPLGAESRTLKDHDVIDIAGTVIEFYYIR